MRVERDGDVRVWSIKEIAVEPCEGSEIKTAYDSPNYLNYIRLDQRSWKLYYFTLALF